MNVNTSIRAFGKYSATSYPDGSQTVVDPDSGRYVELPKGSQKQTLEDIERLFEEKYKAAA